MAHEIRLAERMAAWRSFRGLTLQAVADAGGCSKQTISYVELGDQLDFPSGKLLLICKKAFKCDIGAFFGPLPKVAS